eukprot:160164-Pyramimonas_sp.AAC.1
MLRSEGRRRAHKGASLLTSALYPLSILSQSPLNPLSIPFQASLNPLLILSVKLLRSFSYAPCEPLDRSTVFSTGYFAGGAGDGHGEEAPRPCGEPVHDPRHWHHRPGGYWPPGAPPSLPPNTYPYFLSSPYASSLF